MNNTLDSHISHVRFIACIRKIVSLAGLLLFLFLSFNSECYAASKNRDYSIPSDEAVLQKYQKKGGIKSLFFSLIYNLFGIGLVIMAIAWFFGAISAEQLFGLIGLISFLIFTFWYFLNKLF